MPNLLKPLCLKGIAAQSQEWKSAVLQSMKSLFINSCLFEEITNPSFMDTDMEHSPPKIWEILQTQLELYSHVEIENYFPE